MTYIGESINRVDAKSKVSGQALYPGDFSKPDQLCMKILFANRPHAIIRNINISKAERIPGVFCILTAKDVPNNEYGLSIPDQPVLCGPGSNKPFADRVRFVGDQIALVVAENEKIAQQAINLIEVEFDDLPVISDIKTAISNNSFIIHPENKSNIFCHYKIKKGDIISAFDMCDVIIEDDYITPVQEHAFLQPEAGFGFLDDNGRITIVVGGQWAHEDQEQIAHALDLPLEKIRIIYPAIGGAFGGREDMSVQIVLALAVMKLHERGIDRPIKIVWSREESIIGHHKRHLYQVHAKWGATSDGKILAAEVDLYADGGAYSYTSTKVLGNATLLATGPYDVPNVNVNAYAVYTNNIPGGAFRGFGGPQAAFQAEMQVNKLAEVLGMDRVQLRMQNLFSEGSEMSVGTKIPKGVSIKEVVKDCACKSGWKKSQNTWILKTNEVETSDNKKVGIGFACGYKNIGFSFGAKESCVARIELLGEDYIDKAFLYHAGAEVGQGSHTVFLQMAADALGISIDKVKLIPSDTLSSGNSGSVSASRMTFMAGNSIIGAANIALEKWKNNQRPAIGEFTYLPPSTSPFDPVDGHCLPNFAYGYVAEGVFAEVDVETGEISLKKIVCSNDVGKAINPQQVEGQIEGAIVQAAGYVLMENFIQDSAIPKTRHLSTYLIPTALDIPEVVESSIMEFSDPLGPEGARGMGEMPYLPFAPAVVDAIHDATGKWFNKFPLTAEEVLRGLGKIT